MSDNCNLSLQSKSSSDGKIAKSDDKNVSCKEYTQYIIVRVQIFVIMFCRIFIFLLQRLTFKKSSLVYILLHKIAYKLVFWHSINP